MLRQRTDAYQYDVDQLFLGTLAFVVGTFLAPTVLVYAALFFLVRHVAWLKGLTGTRAERLNGLEKKHASCLLKADRQIEQAIGTAERVLRIAETALNAFPLFELLLRVKEPSRLPAGIYFEVDTPRVTSVASLRIRVSPLNDCQIPLKHVLTSRTRQKASPLSSSTARPKSRRQNT